jgi:hypothetical protein
MIQVENSNSDVNLSTTIDDIQNIFGELIADINNISDEEYQNIIQRCNNKNWQQWKASWEKWNSNNFVELQQ